MGSDGLFDNVFDHEIESVVSRFGASDPEVAHKTGKIAALLQATILVLFVTDYRHLTLFTQVVFPFFVLQ